MEANIIQIFHETGGTMADVRGIQACSNNNVSLNLVSLELNGSIKTISQITMRSRNSKFK